MVFLFRSGTYVGKEIEMLGKEASSHTFLAGLLGGYMVFGRGIQSSVNQQIVIYVFARVVLALARLSVQKDGLIPRELREKVTDNAWPAFAALSWAGVMWLYRWHPETIQPSLKSSMKYMGVTPAHEVLPNVDLSSASASCWVGFFKRGEMPTLKQVTCHVEWSASGPNLPLQEYGTAYSDGLVETYIAVPPISTPFCIHVKSDGYIAPGLSIFVYMDGEYQCNRGRNNLKIPSSTSEPRHTNVDFIVRQKEELLPGGGFIGRQWRFGKLDEVNNDSNLALDSSASNIEYMGTIEVVVLRSAALQRAKAPEPMVSEKHPLAFASTSMYPINALTDLGGFLDGSSKCNELPSKLMLFGGDAAWEDNHETNHTSPYGHGWATSFQPGSQRQHTLDQQDRSSSASKQAASPAIVINVTQPPPTSPSPWDTFKSQNRNTSKSSAMDSWASTPRAPSFHENWVGPNQGNRDGDAWQTWIHGTPKQRGSAQSDWKVMNPPIPQHSTRQSSSSSSDSVNNKDGNGSREKAATNAGWDSSDKRSRGSRAPSASRDWNAGGQDQQTHGSTALNYQGIDQSNWNGQQSKPEWNNTAHDGHYSQSDAKAWETNVHETGNQNGSWDNHGSGSHKSNWDTRGSHNEQGSGWANGGNDGNWNSAQQSGQESGNMDNNHDSGDWNANQNSGQGEDGWNGNGQGGNDYDQPADGYGEGQDKNEGNDWNNANPEGQEPHMSTSQNWNSAGNNQEDWAQNGRMNDNQSATAGGFDPAKARSRTGSFGKAKSAISNLYKRASINSAVQKTGWPPAAPNIANDSGPIPIGPQTLGPPGAWPVNQQLSSGLRPPQNGLNGFTRPYHLMLDAAGNPRLPDTLEAAPPQPPPPPPPPAFQPTNLPYRVQQGEPALYQHKVGSPQYIDSHEKPYAVFIFRYRTKAALEQMLHITIPETDDIEKARLANLTKEELIAEVIKTKVGSTYGTACRSTLTMLKSRMGSKADTTSVHSLPNMPPSVNGFVNKQKGHGRSGQPSDNFGATLNNKLAALADENSKGNSDSSGSKSDRASNNAPPGSPNGNPNIGGPLNAQQLPNWGKQDNGNWTGQPSAAWQGGGGHVHNWLDKTPAGASVSGHKPWGGSVKMAGGGGSTKGGNMKSQSRDGGCNGNGMNWEGSRKSSGGHESRGPAGGNSDRAHNNNGGAASQQNGSWNNNGGHGGQAGDWNNSGNNVDAQTGGWATNGNNGYGGGNDNDNGNGEAQNTSGNEHEGNGNVQSVVW
ncbi:MAG: hypothetical protein Q9219_002915 [cf. Caloplaca sp. 3 TL-2023]